MRYKVKHSKPEENPCNIYEIVDSSRGDKFILGFNHEGKANFICKCLNDSETAYRWNGIIRDTEADAERRRIFGITHAE